VVGPRELLESRYWSGKICWRDHHGYHRQGHRPDLICKLDETYVIPVEVELTQKSAERLRAILELHAAWPAVPKQLSRGEGAGLPTQSAPARTLLSGSHRSSPSPTTDLLRKILPCLPRRAGESAAAGWLVVLAAAELDGFDDQQDH
jgi:hypothetical protein